MLGIDVSHHQGPIDWRRVAQNREVRFAYLKATEGGDFSDRRFAENLLGARRAGLRVGAYHFFTFCTDATKQAEHFLQTVKASADMLPPALDVEFGGNCRSVRDRVAIRKGVFEWLRIVEAGTGQRPVLYLTPEAFEAYFEASDFDSISDTGPLLWYRSILREPQLPYAAQWTFWQYHARGHVDGIDGPVDLNATTLRWDWLTVAKRYPPAR